MRRRNQRNLEYLAAVSPLRRELATVLSVIVYTVLWLLVCGLFLNLVFFWIGEVWIVGGVLWTHFRTEREIKEMEASHDD